MPTWGCCKMLIMLSSLRLPLRSPKASVCSSTTSTLPAGSPRGDTSQLPSAAVVANRKNGLAAMNRADAASTWSMAFSATACVGSPMNSRSSAVVRSSLVIL